MFRIFINFHAARWRTDKYNDAYTDAIITYNNRQISKLFKYKPYKKKGNSDIRDIQIKLIKRLWMVTKRGQITLFIIVGILLLASTAIILSIKQESFKQKIRAEIPETIEKVPFEVQPVKDYVQKCLDSVSKEALNRIGMYGGYIAVYDDPDLELAGKTFNVDLSGRNPTDADAVEGVVSGAYIPYWWHLKTRNSAASCQYVGSQPILKGNSQPGTIENQLSRYVERHIKECLGDFDIFAKQGFEIKAKPEPIATAEINDEGVSFFLDYPIDIKSSTGAGHAIKAFSVYQDVRLGRLYSLADEITGLESRINFLEEFTLEVISAYSGIDADMLPPMSGTDFSPASKIWLRQDVARKLQNFIADNIQFLTFSNTANFNWYFFPDNNLKQGLFNRMMVRLKGIYPDITAEAVYIPKPDSLYLHIMDGEIIKARDGIAIPLLSLFVAFQRYDLPYDVSYPVMLKLTDRKAYNGQGYDFWFALEPNIRNNLPLNCSKAFLSMAAAEGSSDYLCKKSHLDSGEVRFDAVDHAGKPVEDAQVQFISVNTPCLLGQTEMEKGKAKFSGKFPTGAIGTLVVSRQGYSSYVKEYFYPSPKPQNLGKIVLKKSHPLKMKLEKYEIQKTLKNYEADEKTKWNVDNMPLSLGKDDEVTVILEKKKENNFEPQFMLAEKFTGTEPMHDIELAPGNYTAKIIFMVKNADVTITKESMCKDMGFSSGDDECKDMQDVSLSSKKGSDMCGSFKKQEDREKCAQGGASSLDVETEYFAGTHDINFVINDMIYNKKELTIRALEFDLPSLSENQRSIKDLEAWGKIQEFADNSTSLLLPVLK